MVQYLVDQMLQLLFFSSYEVTIQDKQKKICHNFGVCTVQKQISTLLAAIGIFVFTLRFNSNRNNIKMSTNQILSSHH